MLYLFCKLLDVSIIIFEVTVNKVSILKMRLPSLKCLNNLLKFYVLKLGKNLTLYWTEGFSISVGSFSACP